MSVSHKNKMQPICGKLARVEHRCSWEIFVIEQNLCSSGSRCLTIYVYEDC